MEFQSTRPIRGATAEPPAGCHAAPISIHAPHTGRDFRRSAGLPHTKRISIHAPHTGRDFSLRVSREKKPTLFQSTRPIRGATWAGTWWWSAGWIFQSTRPIRGATGHQEGGEMVGMHFNPRAPYGARHLKYSCLVDKTTISIHAPHTGRDQIASGNIYQTQIISIHAPHTGRDDRPVRPGGIIWNFNPRAPYGARRKRGLS